MAAIPTHSPVPIEKSADLEMVGGRIVANRIVERLPITPHFERLGTIHKPKKAARHPQMPHTPSESPRYFAAAG